jgi:hypothetical protein
LRPPKHFGADRISGVFLSFTPDNAPPAVAEPLLAGQPLNPRENNMQTQPSSKDAAKLTTLRQAFAASPQLPTMFASFDDFAAHMMKAEFDTSPELRAEFPDAASYAAYIRWADRKASKS